MPDYEYAAFVSYRHLDATEPGQQWAAWVQTLLERYTTPPELAGQQSLYGDPVPAKMERVFRDKDQLPAHGDLGALIHDALEKSRVLIVLCTPNAVASPWVADEILHFKKLGRADRIIAIVLRGEPHAPDPRNECYPPPLRHKLHPDGTVNPAEKEHPIYIDLRPPLGATAATSPEDYRALLHAADLYKDGPIEAAVTKYTSQLEEARILLLGGVLGLTPRELTQRDLLRRIEEEKTLAAEEKKRAEWEAEQKHIAETARAEAERQRKRATLFSKAAAIAAFLALLAAIIATIVANKAEKARIYANEQKARAEQGEANAQVQKKSAEIERLRAIKTQEIAEQARSDAQSQKTLADEQKVRAEQGETDALAAKEKATTARAAADEVVRYMQYDLRNRLDPIGRLDLMKAINDRVALYQEQHPPDAGDAKALVEADQERSVMLDLQGDIAKAAGRLDDALVSFQTGLAISERIAEQDPSNVDRESGVSRFHSRIGDTLADKGEPEAALTSYQKGLEISERLVKQNPGNARYHHDVSLNHQRIGDIQQAKGEFESALVSYRKGFEIDEQLAKQEPGNALWQRDVYVSHMRFGEIQEAKGEREAALVSYRTGLEIIKRLAEQDPGNALWQHDVSNSHNNIGNIQIAKGERKAALVSYRKSLEIRERLAKQDPGNADWQRDASASHGNIGNIQMTKGERDAALASYQKSLEFTQRLVALDASNAQWQLHAADSQGFIADLHLSMPKGDMKEAARLIREGMQRLDALEKRIQPDQYFKGVRANLLHQQSKLPKGQ